jgi:hypothetical protein
MVLVVVAGCSFATMSRAPAVSRDERAECATPPKVDSALAFVTGGVAALLFLSVVEVEADGHDDDGPEIPAHATIDEVSPALFAMTFLGAVFSTSAAYGNRQVEACRGGRSAEPGSGRASPAASLPR